MTARAPDYAAPLIGWRTWLIDGGGPEARLRSVVSPTAWPVGEPLIARCPGVTFAHLPPATGCRCGVHAARDVTGAAFHAELPSRAREPLAIGLVALWGLVIEAESGWRGSAAYPSVLYVPLRRSAERESCERLAWDLSAYGVPVGVIDCTRRGIVAALRAVTPAARRPLPLPLAAAA
jgi:hypothetical protein